MPAFSAALEARAQNAYITNSDDNTISVINTETNTVTATLSNPLPGGLQPWGVAATPTRVYVTNRSGGTVSVVDVVIRSVTAQIPVGNLPFGVAVTPDGGKVYVANNGDNSVSVIDAARDRVTATIPVGRTPIAFGNFIQSAPRFAGTPGKANCYGQSVAALLRQYGGLNAAAAALGFPSIRVLQNEILAFCER